MKKLFFLLAPLSLWAHFLVMLPSSEVVEKQNEVVKFDISLMHTFSMSYMNIKKPIQLGVYVNGQKHNLLNTIKPAKIGGKDGYKFEYKFNREGLYTFYMEPDYYFEPSEEVMLKHYAKVMIESLGISDDYYKPIGLRAEIVPMAKPFGLFTGNVFKGKVLFEGKPVKNCSVEVSYYNKAHYAEATKDSSIQAVRTDENGEFVIGLPMAGWWAMNAIIPNDEKAEHNGKKYDVEIGATMLLKAYAPKLAK